MSRSRMKTPSRPDLHSIFNTRQRKPRSTPAKSAHAKSIQSPAIVPGDLLQLYTARIDGEGCNKGTADQHQLLSAKRSRSVEDLSEKRARSRIDSSQIADRSLEKEKDNSESSSAGLSIVSKQTLSNEPIRSTTNDVISVEEDLHPVVHAENSICSVQAIRNEGARLEIPMRLTRAQMLMKSALVPDRAPIFPEASKSQDLISEAIVSRPQHSESSEANISAVETEGHIARIVNWSSEAKRLITPGLHLPIRLQNLKEIFKAVETTMSVHKARRRICVSLPELSSGVQSIAKKAFTKSFLAQIVHLFPAAYSLHNKVIRNSESGKTENVLMITMVELPETCGLNHLQRSQYRLDKFHDCLLRHIFGFYAQWTKKNHPDQYEEVQSTDLYSLKSWHSAFPLDRCPAVPLCKLPAPPPPVFAAELSRLVGKDDVQRQTAAEMKSEIQDAALTEAIPSADIPTELQGIPLSLIQKVRMREAAARQLSEQIGSKEKIQEDLDLDSLPDFVVLVHGMFSALGKPSMFFSAFVSQLKHKLKDQFVSEGSVVNRVNLLLEFLPNFCQKVVNGRIEVFRIDLAANVAHLRAELRYSIKQKRVSKGPSTCSNMK